VGNLLVLNPFPVYVDIFKNSVLSESCEYKSKTGVRLKAGMSVCEVHKSFFPTFVQLYLGYGQETEGYLLTGHERGDGKLSFLLTEAF